MTDAVGRTVSARASAFDVLLRPPEYRRLRERLIRIFARRSCAIPQDLADETLSRVLGKLPDIADSYVGDPVHFVLAVARNVHREYTRRPRTVPLNDQDRPKQSPEEEVSARERASECLESCLSKLDPAAERLIREYYRDDEGSPHDRRRALAEERGLAINALRVKAFRIRQRLARCVTECSKDERDPEMKPRFLHYGV